MCYAPTPNQIPLGKLSNNCTKKNLNGVAGAIQGSVSKYHSKNLLQNILPASLELQLHTVFEDLQITEEFMQYNMYHKRPLDAQIAQPIPMLEDGRSERPKAGSRPPQGIEIAVPFWWALLSHRRGHNGS